MNRLVLLGNGFDLAHGMKTSYKDFLDDYWGNLLEELKSHSSSMNKKPNSTEISFRDTLDEE